MTHQNCVKPPSSPIIINSKSRFMGHYRFIGLCLGCLLSWGASFLVSFFTSFSNPVVKIVCKCWIGLGIIYVAAIFFGYCAMSYTPLQGHVTIDMESVYYKNNPLIPVSIQVTGPNTAIGVLLYTKNSSNSSSLVSILADMKPDLFGQESDDVLKRNLYSNNVLVGSYLGNGKYCVFINTTNRPAGYYELICIREYFWKETCEGKSFYLVNKNQQ